MSGASGVLLIICSVARETKLSVWQSKGVGSSVTSFSLEISEVRASVATHSLFLFFFFWSVHARSADPAAAVWLLLIILFVVLSFVYPKRVFDFIGFAGDNFNVMTT